ncbi:MAG TPA: endonuclease/exonuclease/phosphatase family protein, partial [Tepidisphaeraceae bacterium]|nr:endonuclease/exonuclease/phosphatase family protein [Tepidisphaeraceae bacterium]
MNRTLIILCSLVVFAAGASRAETITVATYNVQLFDRHFLAHHLTGRGMPDAMSKELRQEPHVKELIDDERETNDRLNWIVASVIQDRHFNPDIICLEECCDQTDLTYFNHRWLDDGYATAIVFPTNTTRQQNVAMMLKRGFTVEEKRDQYYLEKDPVPNARGDRLFARGPSFLKVKSPGGYEFWVGVTHQKSKRVDPPLNAVGVPVKIAPDEREKLEIEAGKWRLREAARTHQIMMDLAAAGPKDVMLLGDMNDELGADDIERKAGGDAVAMLVGPPEDGYVLATKPLADADQFSFGGYWQTRFRSLIDHIIVSPSMKGEIETVAIFKDGL